MGYGVVEGGGAPMILSGGGGGDMFGSGAFGALILGALLGGNGFGGNRGTYDAASEAQFQGVANQIQGLQSQVTSGQIDNSFNALGSLVTGGITSVSQAIGGVNRDVNGVAAAQAQANFTTLQSINSLGAALTAQSNQNALQQLNSFNQLNTNVLQGFNEIGRDNAQSFNQLIMGQNTLAAQMAACCCSIEKSISTDGAMTRALINDIRLQELQGQLADAKTQNVVATQQIALQNALNAQAATIITHLKPVSNTIV